MRTSALTLASITRVYRFSYLVACLVAVGLCCASVRASHIPIYVGSGLACAIISGTITSLCLATYTLRSMSLVYVTRASALPLVAIVATAGDRTSFTVIALAISSLVHGLLFSERFLSRITRPIGHANEDMFLLATPRSVFLWFTFTWGVMWATFVETIHLFYQERTILGIVTSIVVIIIGWLFLPSQLRSMYRRCVIVPHGLVTSDAVTLTDVVLLPLSKIKNVSLAHNLVEDENSFFAVTSSRNVVDIELTEFTDSLIVREGLNETKRHNVNRLFFSVADAHRLVQCFHQRFHQTQAPELSRAQEIMVEKELGIETAPRSDAKLPQHRTKKKK